MPTVMGLALGAAAVPPLCPSVAVGAPSPPLCTEGRSLLPIMADPAGTAAEFGAAFMQYPFCMHDESNHFDGHDGCIAAKHEPRVMGYVVRTRRWRYIEWVRFNMSTTPPTPLWEQLLGTELYDHTAVDTVENVAESVNVVADPALASTVKQLSTMLHAGWRGARLGDKMR